MNNIDLVSIYKKNITEYTSQLIEQKEDDILSATLTPQQIRTTIHNQKIRALISNCRQSLELMGKNKKILKDTWYERLEKSKKTTKI
ncbi:hypothetical protein [Calidifontibacillus erzurumensis]|uniref:hypothetical protein n=1 Tax=Calidifontibacillus erzurumensis TaxID=2741433 RepID=UPI0035B55B88